MDFGLTGKLGEYYLTQQCQKNGVAGKSSGVSFAELAAAKVKGMSPIDYSQVVKGAGSFSDVFPDYQVITKVGTGNVQQGLWERNDFPFDKYFDNSTTVEELNNWRPTEYYPPWEPPVSRLRATRKWYFPPSEPPLHIVAAHIFDLTINLLIVVIGELQMQYRQIIYKEVFLCLRRQKSEAFWNFWEKT